MADEEVLEVGIRADTSGLDQAQADTLRFLDQFERNVTQSVGSLPPLDINTGLLAATLREAGNDVGQFFADIKRLDTQGPVLNDFIDELAGAATGLQANSEEARALEQAIRELRAIQAQPVVTGPAAQAASVGTPDVPGLQAARTAALGYAEALASVQRSATSVASATGQSLTFATQPAVAAADTLIERLGLLTRSVESTRAVLATPLTPPVPPTASRDLALLASGLQGQRDAALLAEQANAALLATMLQEGQAARRAAGDNEGASAAIGQLGERVKVGTEGFDLHSGAAKKATSAIAILAAQSVGATGPIGQLAQAVLLGAGGLTALAAGAAGFLALAAAYRFVTTAEREASEAQQKHIDGLLREADTAAPAAIRAQEALTAALRNQQRAREGLRVQDVVQPIAAVAQILGSPAEAFGAEFARRAAEKEAEAVRAVAQAHRDVKAAQDARQASTVQAVTQAIQLHVTDAATLGQARDLERAIQAELRNTNLTLAEQIPLRQQLLQLQSALRDDPNQAAIRSGQRQAIQDDLAARQQAIGAESQQLQAALAEELITRQQFYQRRRRLAQDAATADIGALARELAGVLSQEGRSPAETKELATQARHLSEQIALRRVQLGQQEQQIQNEERLSDATILRQAGIGSAGGVSDLQPGELTQTVTLKPRLDLAEVNADLGAFEAQTERIRLDERFETARKNAEALAPILEELGLSLEDIGNANVTGLDDLDESLRDVVGQLDRVVNAASGIGLIGEEAARSIGSVISLGDALASVAASASTGNILGAVSAGIGVVGQIFAKSAGELEREQAQRENTAALREATAAYRATQERFAGLGGLQAQVDTVRQIAGSPAGQQAQQEAGRPKDINDSLDLITQAARDAGLSLDDLRVIAREHGISLVRDGQLVAGSVEALVKVLEAEAAAALRFAKTFDDQVGRATLESRLSGRTQDPAELFAEQLAGLKGAGAEAIAALFADPSNLQAVRESALSLLHQVELGTLPLESLGTLSKEQLRSFLDSTADYADALQAAADATESFASRLESSSLRLRLQGADITPEVAFRNEINSIISVLGETAPELARQIQGLDLSNSPALREALLGLFDANAAGTLDLGNLTQEEFNRLLTDGAGFLDSFNEATAAATKQLQGVPDFFKLNEAEFSARAVGPNDGSRLPSITVPRALPSADAAARVASADIDALAAPIDRLGGGATLGDLDTRLNDLLVFLQGGTPLPPVVGTETPLTRLPITATPENAGSLTTIYGAITIRIDGTGLNPEQIAAAVKRTLSSQKLAATGNADLDF